MSCDSGIMSVGGFVTQRASLGELCRCRARGRLFVRIVVRYLSVAFALLSFSSLGCESINDGVENCPEKRISSDLHPVFYWGETSNPGTWEFNKGIPMASGRFAQWLDADHLIVSSGRAVDENVIRGLLVLSLAGDAVTVEDWDLFAFDHAIWDMHQFPSTGEIWLLYFDTDVQVYPRLGRVSLGAGEVQVEQVLLDESWQVAGVRDWETGAVLVYATRPSDSKKGFFIVSTGTLASDSLLYGITTTPWSGRGFDLSPDGRQLYWGDVVESWEWAVTWVQCLDLTSQPLQPVIVAERPGAVISVTVNPVDADQLLVNRRVYESMNVVKEDVVELIDVRAGNVSKLDVRTHEESCYTIRNEFPSWRADGNAIVFQSWSSSSGSYGPSRVWSKVVRP